MSLIRCNGKNVKDPRRTPRDAAFPDAPSSLATPPPRGALRPNSRPLRRAVSHGCRPRRRRLRAPMALRRFYGFPSNIVALPGSRSPSFPPPGSYPDFQRLLPSVNCARPSRRLLSRA